MGTNNMNVSEFLRAVQGGQFSPYLLEQWENNHNNPNLVKRCRQWKKWVVWAVLAIFLIIGGLLTGISNTRPELAARTCVGNIRPEVVIVLLTIMLGTLTSYVIIGTIWCGSISSRISLFHLYHTIMAGNLDLSADEMARLDKKQLQERAIRALTKQAKEALTCNTTLTGKDFHRMFRGFTETGLITPDATVSYFFAEARRQLAKEPTVEETG